MREGNVRYRTLQDSFLSRASMCRRFQRQLAGWQCVLSRSAGVNLRKKNEVSCR